MKSPAQIGWWNETEGAQLVGEELFPQYLGQVQQGVAILSASQGLKATYAANIAYTAEPSRPTSAKLLALLPPIPPHQLGSQAFCQAHGVAFPYMTGAMANGIASCELVEAVSRAGLLGSFGAAGLSVERVHRAITRLQTNLGNQSYCINLIHSPNEPRHEMTLVELLLEKQVRLIEASAYLDLTPAVVRYRLAGLHCQPDGTVVPKNRIIAKVSRAEVATRFCSPAPERLVQECLAKGWITTEQAEWGRHVPMCDDLTAEADSGGHTDNRPAMVLLPALLALRNQLQAKYQYPQEIRVGLAGGICTPESVAAAFALGADYVVTGSVNQACVESGSSDRVRKMLAEADSADVIMAPAADMFEMGVKVQVLKRGTMFAMRGQKLYDLYRAFPAWSAIPESERNQVEKSIFHRSFESVWQDTVSFFSQRDPVQLTKAQSDPRHQMALVFRWYLGLSSRWANAGDETRQLDYQVWCGPAMGAFNAWAKGSFLAEPANRDAVTVALNLLYGASLWTRQQHLRQAGVTVKANWFPVLPWRREQIETLLQAPVVSLSH